MKIGILDYGAGNLKNVCRAIEHLEHSYCLVSDPESIEVVDKLIVPGVGAFKVAMEQIEKLGVVESLRSFAEKDKPVLGICLGMQLLFESSSEFGETKGLGLLEGNVELIPSEGENGLKHKVPHIGWNELVVGELQSPLVKDLRIEDAVYFVHSYRANNYKTENLVAHCDYDGLIIPAIVQKNRVFGCQFHPEKSGPIGLNILNSFLRM
ncbi:MAG: imidazole glycerol phosphate synthase subunit HisH [Kangiellaceae bacterium]|nr:imidazole glycerol phosphate synthase subunit HisH [Kangiellaceae bacterium]